MQKTLALLGLLAVAAPAVAAEPTTLTWYGHAAFKLTTPSGKVILIDPWITNPSNKTGKEDLAKIDKADLILISHGHFDHVGDSVAIAKKTKAKLVTTGDLGAALAKYAGYPADQMGFDTLGNFGGTVELLDGEVKIGFVPAVHSSGIVPKQVGGGADDATHFAGNPGGFFIQVKGGPSLYHTGDTDMFGDMDKIKQFGKVDVMLACIGDHFTMGPERAAEAVKLVGPGKVVPMHYGTFPVLFGTPDKFAAALKSKGLDKKMMPMVIGTAVNLAAGGK
jgi:L-ascorbate metabolism protein UlaG (beta-lactamase superfamily)